jgi:hypothetical protein
MDTKALMEMFQQWQELTAKTAQSWAKSSSTSPEQSPLDGFRQMSEVWLKAMSGALKGQAAPVDPAALHKFLDESLEMWTKALADIMGGEEYATAMGQLLSQNLAIQGAVKKAMEPYLEETLKAFNLPSRKQVLGVAEQLKTVESRIEGLEDRFDDLRAVLTKQLSARPQKRSPRRASPRDRTPDY